LGTVQAGKSGFSPTTFLKLGDVGSGALRQLIDATAGVMSSWHHWDCSQVIINAIVRSFVNGGKVMLYKILPLVADVRVQMVCAPGVLLVIDRARATMSLGCQVPPRLVENAVHKAGLPSGKLQNAHLSPRRGFG